VLSAEASVDGSGRTGWKSRQARREAVVRERGGCRSHAAEEEGRRLRSVGGVAEWWPAEGEWSMAAAVGEWTVVEE
jgi:hypothetical protein